MPTNNPNLIFVPSISLAPLHVIATYQGGFGRVSIVESDDVRYALKTLKWELGFDRSVLRDEAQRLTQMPHHRNIIDILGLEWIDHNPYIVMPFCPSNLAQWIQADHTRDFKMIRSCFRDILDGLKFLHCSADILHLDVKPENILLTQDQTWVLSDFGLSRHLPRPSPDGIHRDLFCSGITGTIGYMSPEHFTGQPLSDKTDMFAFGVIAFQILTGHHPFLKDTIDGTVRSILADDPTLSWWKSLSIPSDLKTVCLSCLHKHVDGRPSATDALRSLSTAGAPPLVSQDNTTFDLRGTINRANSYIGMGETSKAESLLQICVRQCPWSILARANLVGLYQDAKRFDDAIMVAREALELSPWYPDQKDALVSLLVNLSMALLQRDPVKAAIHARWAVQLAPDDWQALANLAEACRLLAASTSSDAQEREARLSEGFESIRAALRLNAGDLVSRLTYANLLLIRRDYKTLWPLLTGLVNETGGDNVPVRVLLIETLTASDQLAEAMKWLEPMLKYPPLEAITRQLNGAIEKRARELGNT